MNTIGQQLRTRAFWNSISGTHPVSGAATLPSLQSGWVLAISLKIHTPLNPARWVNWTHMMEYKQPVKIVRSGWMDMVWSLKNKGTEECVINHLCSWQGGQRSHGTLSNTQMELQQSPGTVQAWAAFPLCSLGLWIFLTYVPNYFYERSMFNCGNPTVNLTCTA